MRRLLALTMFLVAGVTCQAQFTPTPAGAYTFAGGVWSPATSTAGGGTPGFVPSPIGLYCYNGTNWVPADSSCFGGGGGGSVTSFSSGNLSPLFTTSVATPSSTPALSFTLSTASANSVFGNCTTGSATPSYCTITSAMLPGGTISGLTTGFVPKAASATSLTNSAVDDGVTTTGFVTSSEPININDPTDPNFVGFTPNGVAAAVQAGKAGWGLAATLTTAGNYLMPDSPASGIWRGANSGGVVTDTISEISGDCTTSGSNAITCTKSSGANIVTSAASLTNNSVVLGAGSQASKTVAGIVTDGTSVLTLGVAGTSVGGVALNNATSGSITLNPATGALGTVTATLPANTGTIAELNLAQTFSAATTFSAAGAASTPGVSVTGASFVGTGTTSTPQLYINQGASAPTTWSTGSGGTAFGINLPSGAAGNFIDTHLNGGATVFSVGANGNLFTSGNGYWGSTTNPSPYINSVNGNVQLKSAGLYSFGSTTSGAGTQDTTLAREGAGIVEVNSGSTAGNTGTLDAAIIKTSAFTQQAASNTGGTCAMSSGTSCTITIGHTYTTPVCIATQQSATLTGGAVGCTVSGTTVTITSAVANSETWGALVFGNPN